MLKKLLLVSVLLLLIGGGIFWLNSPQWLTEFNQQTSQDVTEYRELGTRFGQTSNQQGCLDQALDQLKQCSGFSCTVRNGHFLKSCWQTAQPSEGFCEDVPELKEELSEDDKSWIKDYCWERNIGDEGCRILLRQRMQYCTENARS